LEHRTNIRRINMGNEYDYDDLEQYEYIIWWVNKDFEIDYSIVQGKNENEAIIDFFTNSVDAEDVKNFRVVINNIGE
tara:strand:- start:121 stop:351 length:231 start_codon:yes stop_codon:yes gene_type:complete